MSLIVERIRISPREMQAAAYPLHLQSCAQHQDDPVLEHRRTEGHRASVGFLYRIDPGAMQNREVQDLFGRQQAGHVLDLQWPRFGPRRLRL